MIGKKYFPLCSFIFLVLVLVAAFLSLPVHSQDSLHLLSQYQKVSYSGNLDTILEKKLFRVLTTPNTINYFIYNGAEKGYEYEMVSKFVKRLNRSYGLTRRKPKVRLEMIPVSRDQLIPMLLAGYGDMIAAGLTVTDNRSLLVNFTKPYNIVSEVVVVNDRLSDIKKIEDLSGRKVAIRATSSYYESIHVLNRKLVLEGLKPVEVEEVDENLETEAVIELVSLGTYDITIADSHIADIAVKIFDNVKVVPGVTLRDNGKIAWAVNKDAGKLLKELNKFIPSYKKGSFLGNISIKTYFKDIARIKNRYFNQTKKKLSPHDDLLKKYAEKYGFDWRLLAAIAYQESRFNQKAKNSSSGATGMFQVKTDTAAEEYINIKQIEGYHNVENNIHAGVKYLAWIKNRYFENEKSISESNKLRFTLAAYNVGPAALARARQKTQKLGLDPNRWFKNVELGMLAIGKTEPVAYVSEINSRFVSYSMLGGF